MKIIPENVDKCMELLKQSYNVKLGTEHQFKAECDIFDLFALMTPEEMELYRAMAAPFYTGHSSFIF